MRHPSGLFCACSIGANHVWTLEFQAPGSQKKAPKMKDFWAGAKFSKPSSKLRFSNFRGQPRNWASGSPVLGAKGSELEVPNMVSPEMTGTKNCCKGVASILWNHPLEKCTERCQDPQLSVQCAPNIRGGGARKHVKVRARTYSVSGTRCWG